jgi:hypothetical protein
MADGLAAAAAPVLLAGPVAGGATVAPVAALPESIVAALAPVDPVPSICSLLTSFAISLAINSANFPPFFLCVGSAADAMSSDATLFTNSFVPGLTSSSEGFGGLTSSTLLSRVPWGLFPSGDKASPAIRPLTSKAATDVTAERRRTKTGNNMDRKTTAFVILIKLRHPTNGQEEEKESYTLSISLSHNQALCLVSLTHTFC